MRRANRHSIQRVLLLPLGIACFLCIAVLFVTFGEESHSRLRQALRQRAETVAGAIDYAGEVTDFNQLHRFVSAMGGERDIELIVVVAGRPERIVATTHHEWRGQLLQDLPDATARRLIERALQNRRNEVENDGARDRSLLAVPLVLKSVVHGPERLHGAALVSLEVARFEQELLRSSARTLGLVGLLLLAVAALCAWLLHRYLVKPIVQIAAALRDAEKDAASIPVPPRAPAQLAQMAHQLDRSFKTVRAAEARARAATSAKSEFLARMSHEIRTPMNGVIGMLETLRATQLSAQQGEYLRTASASAETLLVLLNDILDYSKIEAGKLRIEQVAFDLPGVIGSITRLFGAGASRKGVRLVEQIDPAVPLFVKGDPTRVSQVIGNLVNNAVKFTERGSIVVRAHVLTADAHATRVRFAIEDTGIGIDGKARGQLFEAFNQPDGSTARRFGGTGLGLVICRQLVRLMGGDDIRVESERGRGSTFSFDLPFQPAAPGEPAQPPAASTARPEIPPCRVLIVDDSEINLMVARAVLARLGHACDEASNGKEGFERVQRTTYEVVLMDCHMPEIDGFEATRMIRRYEREQGRGRAYIVAATASAFAEDRQKCLESGMDDFLAKPIRAADVAAMFERWRGQTPPAAASAGRGSPTVSPAAENAHLLDMSRIDEMRLLVGSGFAAMVQGLEASTAEALGALRAAVAIDDAAALESSAHELKSSLATMGATAATDLVGQLEVMGRSGALAGARELVAKLETVCRESHEHLRCLAPSEDSAAAPIDHPSDAAAVVVRRA